MFRRSCDILFLGRRSVHCVWGFLRGLTRIVIDVCYNFVYRPCTTVRVYYLIVAFKDTHQDLGHAFAHALLRQL